MGHVRGGVVHREGVGHVTDSKAAYFSFKLQKKREKRRMGPQRESNKCDQLSCLSYQRREY